MVPTGGRCHASERRNRLSFGSGERSRDLKLYCITRLCGAVRARRGIIPLEKLFFFFFSARLESLRPARQHGQPA